MGIRKFVCRQVNGMMGGMMSMARGMMPCALAGGMGDMLMPAISGGFRVDVREDMDDVFIVADLPGVERENIAVWLLSPTELKISGVRCSERAETAGGGQVMRRERTCGRMDRVVSFPSAATAEGAKASLENGMPQGPSQEGRARRANPDRVTIFSSPRSSSRIAEPGCTATTFDTGVTESLFRY